MTHFKAHIKKQIALNGPLGVDAYMALCLNDHKKGYYNNQEPFGNNGDFITAPEISQMFGEMLALWVVDAWNKMNTPRRFVLCEIGPGRGTLMDDLLRSLKQIAPKLLQAADITLIETSPRLAYQQKQKIAHHGLSPHWLTKFSDIDAQPVILIANELFDALPIQQFIWMNGQLHERKIQCNNNDELCFAASAYHLPQTANNQKLQNLPQGTIIELSPARSTLMQEISAHIKQHNGAAAIIDYGSLQPGYGDTLQALSKHKSTSIFANPGYDDLTSHVDFYSLARIARTFGCATTGATQSDFLLGLGLLERAGQLGRQQPSNIQEKLRADVQRLAAPQQMGQLFKVLCITHPQKLIEPFTTKNQLLSD